MLNILDNLARTVFRFVQFNLFCYFFSIDFLVLLCFMNEFGGISFNSAATEVSVKILTDFQWSLGQIHNDLEIPYFPSIFLFFFFFCKTLGTSLYSSHLPGLRLHPAEFYGSSSIWELRSSSKGHWHQNNSYLCR